MIRRYGIFVFRLALVYFSACPDISAQLSRPGSPMPPDYPGSPDIPVYSVTVPEQSMSKVNDPDSFLLKPARTGALIPVNFDPVSSGSWDTLVNGTIIWRAAFQAESAGYMNFIFSPYRVQKGVRIFLYDPTQQQVIGALSDLNNKPFNSLATANISGNTVIVEMQIPAYADSYGQFGIKGIGMDDVNDALKKDEWFGLSGSCNEDINCVDNDLISKIKNSVVRIVFMGHERCTGTLVNSTQNKGVHYVLTAGHCFQEEDEANSAVFYFQYESPFCNGPDGNSSRSLSGATLRARSDHIDFALVELLEPVPLTYNPYYAGWDYSGTAPQSGFVIHHPLGDVKKIAFEEHPLTVASFGSLYNKDTHWLASHWESGTTEAGSSGAPLFDASGRVIGTLTGGLAKCDNPVKDYFQMFSHSWNDFASPEEQLEVWLDPLKSTQGYLDGADPNPVEPPPDNPGFVTAYPNPASERVRLIFDEMVNEAVHITLYSMQGQVVFDEAYGPYQHIVPVDLKNISGGLYLFRIRQGNRLAIIKMVLVK